MSPEAEFFPAFSAFEYGCVIPVGKGRQTCPERVYDIETAGGIFKCPAEYGRTLVCIALVDSHLHIAEIAEADFHLVAIYLGIDSAALQLPNQFLSAVFVFKQLFLFVSEPVFLFAEFLAPGAQPEVVLRCPGFAVDGIFLDETALFAGVHHLEHQSAFAYSGHRAHSLALVFQGEIPVGFDELFGPETVVAGLVFYGGELHECGHRIVVGVGFQVCPAACRIGPVAENLRENNIFEVIADMICHDFAFETDRALVPEILIASIFQTAFPFFHKCGKVGCESCGIQDHRIAQFPECLFLFACEFVAQFPIAAGHHFHILLPGLEKVIVQAFFPG